MSNSIMTFQGISPDKFRETLYSNRNLVSMVKMKMGIEVFTEAALQLIQNPAIAACTQSSVLGCMLKAAIFGFRLSNELGQCWIVPRGMNVGNNKVQMATFQIGYKGWQELAFRSGRVESFDSGIVYQNDQFEFQKGTNAFMNHIPSPLTGKDRGNITHAWASATMNTGRVVFNVVPVDEIERHRLMAQYNTVWANHYNMMAMRIPTRYLCMLQLPKSDEMSAAIEADGGIHDLEGEKVVTTPISQVEEAATLPELHEDAIAEIEACKTKEALRNLWEARQNDYDGDLKKAYWKKILDHARKNGWENDRSA